MGASIEKPIPFFYRHIPKNILLIWLSVLCLPISSFIIATSFVISQFGTKPRSPKYSTSSPKTILVTGVSMSKGLTIARLLSRNTSHRIIGADIEPVPLAFSPGRFSRAVDKFYRLAVPDGENTGPYVHSLLSVIKKEKVDLWISCSSVLAAVEDGEVMRLAEKEMGTSFHAIQFREDVVETLHEKDTFSDYIKSLGLPVPESHRCTSASEVHGVLAEAEEEEFGPKGSGKKKRYIMKPIGVDDLARGTMMTLLPMETPQATTNHVAKLRVSQANPYILQEFIKGEEYCTHALVIRGKVKAFVACPSLELLMHYTALTSASKLSQAMLKFTDRVAADGGKDFSGHLSFDFLVDKAQNKDDVQLWPIECNPRAHTAVVLFENVEEMAASYLSVFDTKIVPKTANEDPVVPRMPSYSYYWVGHDLVTLLILPILELLMGNTSSDKVRKDALTFAGHLLYWRDGTFAIWDPLPFFVLYHVYWPMQFVNSIVSGKAWSRINVSTTKVFAC